MSLGLILLIVLIIFLLGGVAASAVTVTATDMVVSVSSAPS